MVNKLKKLSVILVAAAVACSSSACGFILDSLNNDNNIVLESFVPQTKQTLNFDLPAVQDGTIKPYFYGNEPEANPVRPLEADYVKTETVTSQDELIDTAMRGWKPVFPAGSNLRVLYDGVLKVLNTIIKNDMTDYERVLCIYDFIIYYTVYDLELLEEFIKDRDKISPDNNSFNLKGVFYDYSAVCDGFSRAFSLMCSIEKITNVRITGDAYSEGNYLPHAWNKVLLDGKWYFADSTYGNYIIKNAGTYEIKEYLTHAYFLTADNPDTHRETGILSADRYLLGAVKAEQEYGYYQKQNIKGYEPYTLPNLEKVPHNYVFETKAELEKYLLHLKLNDGKTAEIYTAALTKDDIEGSIRGCLSLTSYYVNNVKGNVYLILLSW